MQKGSAKVSLLSENDFAKFIGDKKSKLIIVDFFADWCGPCVIIAPLIERLAERNPDVKFAKINVDDAPKLSGEYEISTIPCIVFFQDGKEVDRIIGSKGQDIFQEKINDYLKL